MLSDKREVDALHGRIAIGFFIVQDIVVVLVMIGLTALGEAGDATRLGQEALEVLLKGGLFIATIALLMRYVLTPILILFTREYHPGWDYLSVNGLIGRNLGSWMQKRVMSM